MAISFIMKKEHGSDIVKHNYVNKIVTVKWFFSI